ncbi:(deoxy)nucleoside triphosphate pyrophosphohydrolase [Altererythrobacter sp. FM1]|nr:(deoxy)nucleoside triphosphate pyrophosphohydrolase [Altererythrobacter sp. FM1]
MTVVAAALQANDGRWLMQQRPLVKQHGGLWEFPGGKVEHGENPRDALVRELHEEIALVLHPGDLKPVGFAESGGSDNHPGIVILLYSATRWQGEAIAQEAAELGWFDRSEMAELPKPPLDDALLQFLAG